MAIPYPHSRVWSLLDHVIAGGPSRSVSGPGHPSRHGVLQRDPTHCGPYGSSYCPADCGRSFQFVEHGVLTRRLSHRSSDRGNARAGGQHRGSPGTTAEERAKRGQERFKPGCDGGQEAGTRSGLTSRGREESGVVTHVCSLNDASRQQRQLAGNRSVQLGAGLVNVADAEGAKKIKSHHHPVLRAQLEFVDSILFDVVTGRRKGTR